MRSNSAVLLDACVLMDSYLRDVLLRMAEHPRLYIPKWSGEVLEEVSRNLMRKFRLAPDKVAYLLECMTSAFPDATVTGYESLLPSMKCHEKDRHVLAAAVTSGATAIVTFNRKDFPAESVEPFSIEVQAPSRFLTHVLHIDPGSVRERILRFAEERSLTEGQLLEHLRQRVPGFAEAYCAEYARR